MALLDTDLATNCARGSGISYILH